MELRGITFHPSRTLVTETLVVGATAMAGRTLVFFGAGMIVSERTGKKSLVDFLSSQTFRRQSKPFILSFLPTGETREERRVNTRQAGTLIKDALKHASTPCAVLLDFSRMSAVDRHEFLADVTDAVAIFGELGIPVVVSVSIICPPDTAADILLLPGTDAVLLADSIAWNDMPERARKVFFRTTEMPSAPSSEVRVSGKYLLPLSVEWVRQLRRAMPLKPVIAGGGVLRPADVDVLKGAGVTAITLGESVRRLRPWNTWRIVWRASRIFRKK